MIRRPALIALPSILLVALGAVACSSEDDGGSASGIPTVVVTTSILGDVVANVVGDAAEVEVLMPPGVDPHEFELSAAQAASLQEADAVVANGLGFEAGIERRFAQCLATFCQCRLELALELIEGLARPRPLGDRQGTHALHEVGDPALLAQQRHPRG
ncbi:MAG TPA: zinc ABC transporter substrate-binding protein, partial [Acidimicrobiales bacterium]|nr:zinc ABC transporter substrate-binding protein [Acidimicrobiales bacterium]